jgi:hypothetical protein
MPLNRWLKLILGEIFLGVIVCLFFILFNLIPVKTSEETVSSSNEVFIKVSDVKSFRSQFVASYNNLDRVEVLFKNPNLESRDELLLILRDETGNILSQQPFSGYNLGDTSHARMDFAPMISSQNKKFEIEIVPTKIVDGELRFGVKDGNVDFIRYYEINSNIKKASNNCRIILENIIRYQPIVLLLPVICWAIYLWFLL